MGSRYLAAGAAAWSLAYAGFYLAVVNGQDDGSPAWWYVGVVLVGAAALATYAVGVLGKPALITGFVLVGIANLLGLLSIGILLLPAVIAGAVALARTRSVPASQSPLP